MRDTMMDDDLDVYIGRSLKNWSASQPLPAGGRRRLLRAAAGYSEDHDRMTYLLSIWKKSTSPTTAYPIHGDRFLGPLTQSRYWSYHLAASLRLAT
jgi:hypothetical protein